MKEFFIEKVKKTVENLFGNDLVTAVDKASFEPPKKKEFGDIATNISFLLAKNLKRNPKEIAREIAENLQTCKEFEKVEVAGGGFINFFLSKEFYIELLEKVNETDFYTSNIGNGKKILIEYISANPTGPLHVGHGRGAIVGDVLSKVMKLTGFNVEREFYINDAGRQIKLLGLSIFYRMREVAGIKLSLPEDAYKGEYIVEIAKELLLSHPEILETDEKIAIKICADYGKEILLKEIKSTLEKLKVHFDNWFSEKSLFEKDEVGKAINLLKEKGLIYEKDGALWFKSTAFGDDKDRVVKRQSGEYTYFASDIAYHLNKIERGYDKAINIWGADHHGYIPRVKAAIKAFGKEENWLEVVLVQLVKLFKNGEEVKMSKRAGNFVTLEWLIEEVGVDPVRFLFLTKRHDTPLDFDINLALSQKSENPVYYVQYAHARISSILRKATEGKFELSRNNLNLLEKEEFEIVIKCHELKKTLENIATRKEPHLLPYYLIDLASLFHKYYNKYQIINENKKELTEARLYLAEAVRKTIQIGLNILNVNTPRRM